MEELALEDHLSTLSLNMLLKSAETKNSSGFITPNLTFLELIHIHDGGSPTFTPDCFILMACVRNLRVYLC